MVGSCNDSTQQFSKTICSICYEDLKPIVEDLQAISICGHVFHELCIQQWFEYCSEGKKKCPICKQRCSASSASRLYFQSVGDSNDPDLSQKLQTHKEVPHELKLELKRLELKVKGLNLTLESKENDLKSIRNQLCECKELLEKEASLKNEALAQTKLFNCLLESKTKELKTSEDERTKLEKRSMELAKELATIKLNYDLGLKEDEIVKLASLGTKPHSDDTLVNRLTNLLAARNKMYSELLAKYNRDEACSREKVKEQSVKLKKLKKKIQEMETDRPMSTKYSSGVQKEAGPTLNDTCTPQNTIKEHDNHLGKTKRCRVSENVHKSNNKDGVSSYILIDDDAPNVSVSPKTPSYDSVLLSPKSNHTADDMAFVYENGQDKPLPNSEEVASCFAPGLLGPHGTKSYLGKWCKNGQSKGSSACFGSTKTSGDLIAVGADGRGGTIKILKPQNPSSLNSRALLNSAKRGKSGAKANTLQSPGSLQIHHFFSKAGQ